MHKIGIPPPLVDEMSLFQCAVLLGVDERPQVEDGADTFMGRPITPADRERLEKFQAGPSADNRDITNRVMREMGITTS